MNVLFFNLLLVVISFAISYEDQHFLPFVGHFLELGLALFLGIGDLSVAHVCKD